MLSNCVSLKKITVAEGNETLGDLFAYKDCNLEEVVLPDSLKTLSKEAVANCNILTEISIPQGVTGIEEYAFSNCHNLNNMVIPEGVTTIETYAFSSMESLTDIVFLGDIAEIKKNAFNMTYGLTNMDLTHCTSVPVLENTNAFVLNSTRLKIKVPAALYNDWIAADKWSSIANYIVSA